MTTLTEFLLARIAEDEAWARMAQSASDKSPWHIGMGHLKGDVFTHGGLRVAETRSTNVARFIADHGSPSRVLAECEAKRRIVEWASDGEGEWHWSTVLGPLASVYSDHPDYREEWLQ